MAFSRRGFLGAAIAFLLPFRFNRQDDIVPDECRLDDSCPQPEDWMKDVSWDNIRHEWTYYDGTPVFDHGEAEKINSGYISHEINPCTDYGARIFQCSGVISYDVRAVNCSVESGWIGQAFNDNSYPLEYNPECTGVWKNTKSHDVNNVVHNMCRCSKPKKKYSTAGCEMCWTCEKCGNFGGCDNRYWEVPGFIHHS